MLLEKQLNETRAHTLSVDTICKMTAIILVTEAFWNMLQIPWPFNFMSTVLEVSKCSKAAWKKMWSKEKATMHLREFFSTMISLVQDFRRRFSWCFGVRSSTITRIFILWINFIHHKFKSIPLWPFKAQVQQCSVSDFEVPFHKSKTGCNRGENSTAIQPH